MEGLYRLTPDLLSDMKQAFSSRLHGHDEAWTREGPAVMARADELGIVFETLGGNCPVQAEGSLDGKRFYFRARGEGWEFHMAETDEEIFDSPVFYLDRDYGNWPEAGWMPLHEAVGFICDSAQEYFAAKSEAKA